MKLSTKIVLLSKKTVETPSSWAAKMANDYVYVRNSHMSSGDKTLIYNYLFLKLSDPLGYYYLTFSSVGQNKKVCDFLYFMRTSSQTDYIYAFPPMAKSGIAPRWDMDGTYYDQVDIPTYNKGLNNGYIILSSIDGFGGYSIFNLDSNNLIGSIPNFSMLNCTEFLPQLNDFSGDVPNFTIPACVKFSIAANQLTGNLNNLNIPNCIEFYGSGNNITSALFNINKAGASVDLSQNNLNTANIDNYLLYQKNFYEINAPTSNLEIDLSGSGMAAPTNGNLNTSIVALQSIFALNGKTITILHN